MKIFTKIKQLSADTHTPVSLYLKLRDCYPQPTLLESSDYHSSENSFSFIGLDPLLKIVTKGNDELFYYENGEIKEKFSLKSQSVFDVFKKILSGISIEGNTSASPLSPGFFGYTTYDAVPLAETITFKQKPGAPIPLVNYLFYKVLIVINHYKDELYLIANDINEASCEAKLEEVINLIKSRNFPSYQFNTNAEEEIHESEKNYLDIVKKAQQHIKRGDIFQIVLSRLFSRKFSGDEFEVYRALRQINPSPYLFFFDFGDFKLFGSSPEAQLIIKNGKAEIHPIAGTFQRSGNDQQDMAKAEELKMNEKETSEHHMLVDLARNDLSRHCTDVKVEVLKEVQFYSHVIHLVSRVTGLLKKNAFPYQVMMDTFPAGTLSGAPKFKAMELIDNMESTSRGYYGGAIGYLGLDGSINHAIMIRTIMSNNNSLYYRAGAGIVDASVPESELNEVNLKLNALRKAIDKASAVSH